MASQYDLPYTGNQVETLLGKVSDLEEEMPHKTSDLTNDSGFITQANVPTKVSELTNDSGFITNAPVISEQQRAQGVEQGLAQRMTSVEGKIPSSASSNNKLADQDFVNSSIATNTATYISYNGGPFPSVADLNSYAGPHDNNDYAFVVSTDAAGNTVYSRYKYNGSTWANEYDLNNSSFTSAQWAAINSLMTAANTQKLDALPTASELTTLFSGKQDVITDLAAIRAQAAAAYVKPSGGIPASDIADGVIPDVSGKVNTSDIADNLTTDDATKVLSAKQGKVLNENLIQLGQKVNGIPAETLTKSLDANEYWPLDTPIQAGRAIKNNSDKAIKAYNNTTQIGSLLAGETKTFENDVTQFRCASTAATFTINVAAGPSEFEELHDEILAESADLTAKMDGEKTNIRLAHVVLKDGGISTVNGVEDSVAGEKHTAMLPVEDGFAYEVRGAAVEIVNMYSGPYFDNAHFLGYISSSGSLSSTGAKYISLLFLDSSNPGGYANLEIIPNKSLANLLAGTPFGLIENASMRNYATDAYVTIRKNNLDLVINGIYGFYVYGTSVSSSSEYHAMLRKTSATNLDVYIFSSTGTTLYNTSITIPASGIIDTVKEGTGYAFRLIADVSRIPTASPTSSSFYFKLSPIAFSPIVGNPMQMETDISGIKSVVEDMNDPDKIYLETEDTTDEDITTPDPYTESGYVSSINGSTGSNSAMVGTPFISTNRIVAIKTLCPSGSTAGLAFYSSADVSSFISGFAYESGATGTSYISVPSTAKYFRTTAKTTDTKVLTVRKKKVDTLADIIEDVVAAKPRNTHILYGYEGFVDSGNAPLTASRNTITQATQANEAKQLISKQALMLNRFEFVASFVVGDASSHFGLGVYFPSFLITEFRVKNDNGSALLEVYSGSSGADTYGQNSPKVVLSQSCSFALVVGNTYKLSIKRIENQSYGGQDHQDGIVLTITSFADNATETMFVPRNSTVNNGIRNGITACLKGYQYVTVKVGEVTVDNLFVSSEYDPQGKAIIIGDSYVDGDTLIEQGGQRYKYACLLQEAIGQNSFVISGRGGEALSGDSLPYINGIEELFVPKYCIIALGANNGSFDPYKAALDSCVDYIVKNGLIPILTTIPPVGNGAKLAFMNAANAYVKSLGYRYVDINAAVTTDGETWVSAYVLSDGTHLTVAGHQAVFNAFQREFPELFDI